VKQPEHRINGRHGGNSHEFLRSPWIKHYKPLVKTQIPVTDEPENQVVSSSNGKKGICSSGSASSLKQLSSHSRDHDQISVGEGISLSKMCFFPLFRYVVSILNLSCDVLKQRYRIRTLLTKE